MVDKYKETQVFNDIEVDGSLQVANQVVVEDTGVTVNTGVTASTKQKAFVNHTQLTLASFLISVAEADDFGGTKIVDLADSNMLLLGVELNLELTKGLETGGIIGTTDVTMAVGTAIASNATLSGAMIDVLTGTALTATDETPALVVHSNDDGTLTYPLRLADSATLALFLNAAASITTDDTILADGTIDLYWIDVGNVAS